MTSLNFSDAATQDIRGAVQFLKQTSKKVVVGGFCMARALTLLAAMHVAEMDAGACFYGIPPAEYLDPKSINVPLICHFAIMTTGARRPRWTNWKPYLSNPNRGMRFIVMTRIMPS